jgi:sulfonate transport system permease protein
VTPPETQRRAGGARGFELGDAAWAVAAWLRSPAPYLMLLGYALLVGAWYLSVDLLALPRFEDLPGVQQVFHEWTSPDPSFGLSIYTPVYYEHILTSVRRVAIAFALATSLGVPVGLLLGASERFRDYVFPVLELLRPIPILAWVPLAIIMFASSESPVVFLTFLASFFATALNTQLGVRSIGPHFVLAARCLGASDAAIFRHVILPGALPYIFTGLEISVGVAWFSLVAAEMVSGQFGLGYVINTSYTMVQYPTIVIGMLTLGLVGYVTSALVRLSGRLLMGWRARSLALGGG